MTNNLWRCLLYCLESADTETRTLAKRYVKDTAHYLHTGKINLAYSLMKGNQMPEDVEPEADALIDISLLSAEQRLHLLDLLNQAHQLCDGPEVKAVKTSDEDEHEFVGRIISCSDAMRKLSRHLSAMRMDFASEIQFRHLCESLLSEVKLSGVLKHIHKHPETMCLRTTEMVMSYVNGVTEGELRMDQEGIELLKYAGFLGDHFANSPRKPEWYETFIPQRDGWALSLGDYLDGVSDNEREFWIKLLELASAGGGLKPSKSFLKTAGVFRENVSESEFVRATEQVESAMQTRAPVWVWDSKKGCREQSMFSESSTLILCGFVRLATLFPSARTFRFLENTLERCFAKIVGIGPRSEPLGQMALDAIVSMDVEGKIDCIEKALISFKKNKNVKRRIERALQKCRASA